MASGIRELIKRANEIALKKMQESTPVLVDISKAKDVIPGMDERMVLHAGPPLTWDQMSPPVKNGLIGAVLYEKWARTVDEAIEIIAQGEVKFAPCHEHHTVGSMAGITSPSMWVYVVEEKNSGKHAYCALYEGRGKTLGFGSYGEETLHRLQWMENTLGPLLKRAIATLNDGIAIKPIQAKALQMGDECHNRYVASTLWYVDMLIKPLLSLHLSGDEVSEIYKFLTEGHYNSFLTLSMAGCKAIADAAHRVENSSLVTAMARNGTEFGIRVSGLGDRWFTAPAQKIQALYFPGFDGSQSVPDLGDSSITETVGLGGFALAAAPVTMQVIGKGLNEALVIEQEMSEITLGRSETYKIPYLDFKGTPIGIDILKVVETNITPLCVTAVASTKPNVGMIGAGVVRQPLECFKKAVRAFAEEIKSKQ